MTARKLLRTNERGMRHERRHSANRLCRHASGTGRHANQKIEIKITNGEIASLRDEIQSRALGNPGRGSPGGGRGRGGGRADRMGTRRLTSLAGLKSGLCPQHPYACNPVVVHSQTRPAGSKDSMPWLQSPVAVLRGECKWEVKT